MVEIAVASRSECGQRSTNEDRVDPQHDQRGVHSAQPLGRLLSVQHVPVGGEHGARERLGVEALAGAAQGLLHVLHGAPRRLGATAVAAGPVGQRREPVRTVARDGDAVLVGAALAAFAAAGDGDLHHRG